MNKITVRSYNRTSDGHCHHYHQILLPIKGYIDLKLDDEAITACYGDCVVILAGCFHEFYAHEDFRFLVIDTDILPNPIYESGSGLRILDEAAQQYLVFVEKQIVHHIEDDVQAAMLTLLYKLILSQCASFKIDPRIRKVIQLIHQDVSRDFSIEELASAACLSHSQFKLLFNKSINMTPIRYITKLKMEKARSLLSNTDTPINLIAEQVGFCNPSSFTRSFNAYFGVTPKTFRSGA
jgi:AraC-like DNA-binding protein